MAVTDLMNQSITIYGTSSYDKYGKIVVGSGTTLKARAQQTTKKRLLPNGDVITITLILYVPSSTTVAVDDKITFSSQSYKVFGKYVPVDGAGVTSHIKLECTQWQA